MPSFHLKVLNQFCPKMLALHTSLQDLSCISTVVMRDYFYKTNFPNNASSTVDTKEEIIYRLGKDPVLAHRTLFRHRHSEETKYFHHKIIRDWHSLLPRVLTMMFRGGAKSTIAEETFTMMGAFEQFHNCLIIGETEPRAQERLAAIKHEIESNEYLFNLFGDLKGRKWQETYIELNNGVVIQAYGRGQSLRGVKHLHYRPDMVLLDDIENEESIKTPELRLKTMDWFFKTLIPALSPDARIRIAATPLHPEALAVKLSQTQQWHVHKFPLIVKDDNAEEQSIWPERFPIQWCREKRQEYAALGQTQSWNQEYMCEAEDPASKIFTADMFRYEPLIRTWHPVYAVYDPARTTKSTSSMTGKVVGSWVNNRLIIWEASGHLWKPSEMIQDMFDVDTMYSPVAIGVEQDGLHEFIFEPLRHEQVKRGHPVPIRPLKAPKGKTDFIKSVQPFFKAGEIIFSGSREQFQDLENQLLSFPSGRNDIPNALAYFLTLRPGLPIYDDFGSNHIQPDISISQRHPLYLCTNATNQITTAVLVQIYDGVLSVLNDYVQEGAPGSVLGDIIRQVGAFIRTSFTLITPRKHFEPYDNVGLVSIARRIPVAINRGGLEIKGREELRAMMQRLSRGRPALRVSERASWTTRALAGGYAREIGKEEATPGTYRVLIEGLESFAASVTSGLQSEQEQDITYAYTSDGRKFISAMPSRD